MNESDIIRLRHMLDAAREALSFIAGRSSEDLSRDRMLVLALVKEIEIIGEAASRISDDSRKALPRIPWPKIIAMRNRVIPPFAEGDLLIVWDTLTGALPELLRELEITLTD